jgi:hypothetical protein
MNKDSYSFDELWYQPEPYITTGETLVWDGSVYNYKPYINEELLNKIMELHQSQLAHKIQKSIEETLLPWTIVNAKKYALTVGFDASDDTKRSKRIYRPFKDRLK